MTTRATGQGYEWAGHTPCSSGNCCAALDLCSGPVAHQLLPLVPGYGGGLREGEREGGRRERGRREGGGREGRERGRTT